MAADYPYFKFYAGEWSSGDITLEDYATQGVFVNVCAYYWSRSGNVSKAHLYKRFRDAHRELDMLGSSDLIRISGDDVSIQFLDEQLAAKCRQSDINTANGKKGGRPRKNRNKTESVSIRKPNGKRNITNIEENREEEKREYNTPIIPKGTGMDIDLLHQFEAFRKAYPGRSNGLEVELKNATKKHKDFRDCIPKLMTALESEIEWKQIASTIPGRHVPSWANLQTWINQRRWDQKLEVLQSPQGYVAGFDPN
jgi:hypothetical protein